MYREAEKKDQEEDDSISVWNPTANFPSTELQRDLDCGDPRCGRVLLNRTNLLG